MVKITIIPREDIQINPNIRVHRISDKKRLMELLSPPDFCEKEDIT